MKKLYIYDVRGIQKYIFRTNKMKEIIGASALVEDIILTLFKKCAKQEGKKIIADVSSTSELQFQFNEQNTVDAEVMYYGGGNLLVLYEDEKFAEDVSKKMRVELIKKTHSLQVAYAGVDAESMNSYKKNYESLRARLEEEKSNMPMCKPIQGFPVTLNDPLTGAAFSKRYNNKMCTHEVYEKLKKYEELEDAGIVKRQFVDEFGTEEGENRIAIVHIDGNSMGNRIREEMQQACDYITAAKKYRKISESIQHVFVDTALKKMENDIQDMCKHAELGNREKDSVYKKIISAGDDITFMCNSRIAMQCVTKFMEALEEEGSGFTACAGIFVTHNKYPFSKAYEISEELCDNAKKPSRRQEGNYVDFHIRMGASLNNLEMIRESQYQSALGESLLGRPYHIGKPLNDESVKELSDLQKMLVDFKNKKVARTRLKNLRDVFFEGKEMVEKELNSINSRLPQKMIISDYKILFDAIDILDLKWEEKNDL